VNTTLRRVLIVADESADWIVAGLRQLDRIALAIDEFALVNKEPSPVLATIFWRADLDESQRWSPGTAQVTKVAFTNKGGNEGYDLVLSTRLFVYRRGIARLLGEPAERSSFTPHSWDDSFAATNMLRPFQEGAWERIEDGAQIDAVERRFLRGSGKSQDGFVSRYLNRPLSRMITRLLLRFPTTPNAWTWLISPLPLIAAFVMSRGHYASFVWGLVFFQIFSILDGCDGEIARAKYMESERGRQLDDFFDVLSNILLVVGLGFGLARQTQLHHGSGWFYVGEGIVAAVLIAANEWYLARQQPAAMTDTKPDPLGGTLYPRHRQMIERSGILKFGEKFASLLIQLTKRDVAVLFFLFLALIGLPELILHLLFLVATASLVLAWRARITP
jgi:hypothetical protein